MNIVPLVNLFVKLSFFILFLEIFNIKPLLRWLIYAGACVTTVFYVTTTIVLFALSTPPPGVSLAQKFASFLEPGRSGFLDTVLAVGYFNLFTDFYILLLPISGVLRLQLPKRRKIGVILVFMTGLLYGTHPPAMESPSYLILPEHVPPAASASTIAIRSTTPTTLLGILCLLHI